MRRRTLTIDDLADLKPEVLLAAETVNRGGNWHRKRLVAYVRVAESRLVYHVHLDREEWGFGDLREAIDRYNEV